MAMMMPMSAKPTIGREIGERARLLAHRKGMTQGQVAVNAGLSGPTISALFSGGTQDPPVGTVLKVARVLDVPIEQLLGLSPLPEAPPLDESSASDSRTAELERRFDELTRLVERLAGEIGLAANARIEERQRKKQSTHTRKRAG